MIVLFDDWLFLLLELKFKGGVVFVFWCLLIGNFVVRWIDVMFIWGYESVIFFL